MKNIFFSTIFLTLAGFLSQGLYAQSRYFDERYVYTQAYLNPHLINPGAFGHDGNQQVQLNYRNNWTGIEDAPKTFTLSYNGVVGNRLSAGVIVMSDRFGAYNTSKLAAGLNYRIEGQDNKIGFGITGEYVGHKLSDIGTGTNPSDPRIIQGLAGTEYFDASIGMYGLYQNKFSYGISFPSIVSTSISEIDGAAPDRELGFIVQAGYKMDVQDEITLTPSMIMKKLNNVPTHLDLNLTLSVLNEKLIGGVSYTLGADKRFGFLIGTKLEKLNLYYSYNTSSQGIQSFNNGAHEITLGVNAGKRTVNK
jgi:type IX secretion system PorP/SprF family membrane protein